jgi:hypothetical protein
MKRFNSLYGRPVIPFYRTTLYELVQVRTHAHVLCVAVVGWDGGMVAHVCFAVVVGWDGGCGAGHCTWALLCFWC